MSSHSQYVEPAILDYVIEHSTPPAPVQRRLIDTTAQLGPVAGMQISPLQGTLMEIITRTLRPRLVVEIGTFTGYSALAMAMALPADGRLICLDRSVEWTDIARAAWVEAGVADRIELRLGPALDTLRGLPREQDVDLAFLDADKTAYLDYYEELMTRMSPGGLVLVDNVLWQGRVVDPDDRSDETVALREFNDHVRADPRVEVAVLPVGDGVSVISRRTGTD